MKRKTKKQRSIRQEILKKLQLVSWKEIKTGSLNLQYSKLRQLFISLIQLEKQKFLSASIQHEPEPKPEIKLDSISVEEKEKKILSQAVLIMKRIYFDPDVNEVFEKDMDSTHSASSGQASSPQVKNPIKDIQKTDDFLEFIMTIIRK